MKSNFSENRHEKRYEKQMTSANARRKNARRKRRIQLVLRALVGMLMVVIYANAALGVNYLTFKVAKSGDDFVWGELKLVEDILPYEQTILSESAGDVVGEARFIDSAGKSIQSVILREGEVAIPFDDRMVAVQFFQNGILVQDVPFSFCNFNGLCEPCTQESCSLSENAATCSDCPSGGFDSYCDLRSDGTCDPDCQDRLDNDCPTCAPNCVDQVSGRIKFYCVDHGGRLCYFDEGCFGTSVKTLDPLGACCIGECGDSESLAEWYFAQDVFPQYVVKSPILRTSDEEESKLTEFLDEQQNPVMVYVPDEYEVAYTESELRAQDISAAPIVGSTEQPAVDQREQEFLSAVWFEVNKEPVRSDVDASIARQVRQDNREKLFERLRGFNPVSFVLVLLGTALVCSLGVWLFRRKAQEIAPSVGVAQFTQPVLIESVENQLFQIIMDFRKKGYSHEQLRQWLKQQGYEPEIVEKQIAKSVEQERIFGGSKVQS
ncbi:hypothetical protein HY772_03550 [Candidatus Woesearchaeota archaeon]|nr:hypothetical protein [Candidatus Woesearchaeota archaeon]